MSLFNRKHYKFGKLDITFMIKLSTDYHDVDDKIPQRQILYFATHKWHNHIIVNHIPHMLFHKDKGNKKTASVYYFSPYTFDNFIKYVASMVDNSVIIPNTHDMRFNGLHVTLTFIENIWQRDKNKNLVYKNNRPCIIGSHVMQPIEASATTGQAVPCYYNVPIADETQHASYLIYKLLFCSYSSQQLDAINHLDVTYDNLCAIAKEFTDQFQMEYKRIHGKYLAKDELARKPKFEQFSNGNANAVYIPVLLTKGEKKYINTPRNVHDKNVFNTGESNDDTKDELQKMAEERKERQLNTEVSKTYNKSSREARLKQQSKQRKQRIIKAREKQYKKKAKQIRFQKNVKNMNKDDKKKEAEAKSMTSSNAKPANSLQAKIKERMENKSSATSKKPNKKLSQAQIKKQTAQKEAKIHQKEQAIKDKKSGKAQKAKQQKAEQQKQAKAKQAQAQKASKASTQRNNQKQQVQTIHSAQQTFDEKNRRSWNIDYSSVKQPFVISSDIPTLTQAIKSYFNLRGLPQLVKFKKFPVSKTKLTMPKDITKAFKTGKISDFKYLEIQEDNFKRLANSFIEDEEQSITIDEQHQETEMLIQASKAINKVIPKVIGQYKDNTFVQKRAVQYFEKNFYAMLKRLKTERKQQINSSKHALKLEYQAKLTHSIADITSSFNREERNLEGIINRNANYVYNNSRKLRNQAIDKRIRASKSKILHDVDNNIREHRLHFAHRASILSDGILKSFTTRLNKLKKYWIHTVSVLIQYQLKQNSIRAGLKKLQIQSKYSATDSKTNKILEKQLKDLHDYSHRIEKEYGQTQQKASKILNKNLDLKDIVAKLQSKMHKLQLGQSDNSNELNSKLEQIENENTDLHNQLTQKSNHIISLQKLNDSMKQSSADTTTSNSATQSRLSDMTSTANDLRTQIADIKSQNSDKDSQISDLKAKSANASSTQSNDYRNKISKLQDDLTNQKSKNLDIQDNLRSIKHQYATLSNANKKDTKANDSKSVVNDVVASASKVQSSQNKAIQTARSKASSYARQAKVLTNQKTTLSQTNTSNIKQLKTSLSNSAQQQINKQVSQLINQYQADHPTSATSSSATQTLSPAVKASLSISASASASADVSYRKMKLHLQQQTPQKATNTNQATTTENGIPVVKPSADDNEQYPDALSGLKAMSKDASVEDLRNKLNTIINNQHSNSKDSRHWWQK